MNTSMPKVSLPT